MRAARAATGKVDFTGVQSTMLVTLFLRAVDAEAPHPVLPDRYAAEAVARIDHDWGRLDRRSSRSARYSVVLRASQLDDWTGEFLRRTPDATVLQLGCGLDTRAFRLAPPAGVRWYDVDLPDVIALRRRLYQDSDRYRMIASSVTDESWLDQIPTDRPVLVVAEGLLMYPAEADVRRLLRRITDRFGSGQLLFDGAAHWMVTTTRLLKRVLGRRYPYPPFRTGIRDGAELARWDPALRCRDRVATMDLYDRIPDAAVRLTYRAGTWIGWYRNAFQLFQADF